jgi:hypothetical protein
MASAFVQFVQIFFELLVLNFSLPTLLSTLLRNFVLLGHLLTVSKGPSQAADGPAPFPSKSYRGKRLAHQYSQRTATHPTLNTISFLWKTDTRANLAAAPLSAVG